MDVFPERPKPPRDWSSEADMGGRVQAAPTTNWCKMEMDDLKEIINRVPLEKFHKRYGRYKRLRWNRE